MVNLVSIDIIEILCYNYINETKVSELFKNLALS